MASRAHQFIADLIARRMHIDGYEVVSFDGYSETERDLTSLPPTIIRHRPDLIGIKKGGIAIGEAKTSSDMGSRTHRQINDYISSKDMINGSKLKIYLGVPLTIKEDVRDLVVKADGDSVVEILPVPDRLLPD